MTKEEHIKTTTLPTIEELLSYPHEVKRERKEKQMKRLINHLYNAAAEGKRKIFVEETNLDCCNFNCLYIKNYSVTRGVHCTYDEDDYSEIQIDGYWIEW